MSSYLDENAQIEGIDGLPVVDGYIYIGTQNLDPVLNPITIYSDRALTVALANPQRTGSDGRPANKIWIPAKYSIKIEDVNNVQKKLDLDAGEDVATGTTKITNIQGTNAITGGGTPALTAYDDGETYIFEAANANTGAVTLNWDAIGAKSLVFDGDVALVRNHIEQNQKVAAVYNLTNDNFEWRNPNRKIRYGNEGADIASAATVDLSLATGNKITITGATGPITSFGTTPAGSEFTLTFASTPTITHHATSNIVDGGLSPAMVAGDRVKVLSLGSGDNQITVFRATGGPLSVLGASQAEQEASTSELKTVTPLVQQHHPSACKAWGQWDADGTLSVGYNVSSVADNGVGDWTVNFAASFSGISYATLACGVQITAGVNGMLEGATKTASACQIYREDEAGNKSDSIRNYAAFFGGQ